MTTAADTITTANPAALAALVAAAAGSFLVCDAHEACSDHRARVADSPFEAVRRDNLNAIRRQQRDRAPERGLGAEADAAYIAYLDAEIAETEQQVNDLLTRVDPDNDGDPLTLYYLPERERVLADHITAVVRERVALTGYQLRRAQALAVAYGHTWGAEDLAEVAEPTPAAIAAACAATSAAWGEPATGIVCPTINPATGNVVHSTYSGRTTWSVDPAGRVTLTIARPAGDVIVWAEQADAPPALTVNAALGVHVRHVAALVEALDALGRAAWITSEDGRALLATALPDSTVRP